MATTPIVLEGRKILITGPTSQVAFPLARELARKNEVHGMARFRRAEERERIEASGVHPLSVDLARDPAWRLALLPGIGPFRAQAIVEDRRRHGPPIRLRDLERIRGIGAETVRRLVRAPGLRVLLAGRPLDGASPHTATCPPRQR